MLVMLFSAAPVVTAADGITDLIILGCKGESNIQNLKDEYRDKGWTIVNQDLNEGAGQVWIYLAYKTSSTANPETDYVTDIRAFSSQASSQSLEGRTYYQVGYTSGFDGDLNDGGGAASADIYLYYTKQRNGFSASDPFGGSKRIITGFSTRTDGGWGNGVICWSDGTACDLNKGTVVSAPHIYMMMEFSTQTLSIKNDPIFYDNLVYNGSALNLLKTAPSNYGTMMYSVDNGSWTTTPKATGVGNHKVKYYLEGKNSSGIQFANNSSTKEATVYINAPTYKPSNLNGTFYQKNRTVHLEWTINKNGVNDNNAYKGFKWFIYRNNEFLEARHADSLSYNDKDFDYETKITYTVYYVSNEWDEDTKKEDAKAEFIVDTRRHIPVNNLTAVSENDRIIFTWTSPIGYPLNWGNKFNIYVDKETEPIATIIPGADQTTFRWEHRATDKHADRQEGIDTNVPEVDFDVPYVEEPLSICASHNYTVVGAIDNTPLDTAIVEKKAVGKGTTIYEFKASKGSYAGMVRLSWRVEAKGAKIDKKYVIDRRHTEIGGDKWDRLIDMSSPDEYLFYNDETALPGIYYDYRLTLYDQCDDGKEVYTSVDDIGFSQSTGTVSGRITYGSSGSSVPDVNVIAVKAGATSDDDAQYRSIHFIETNGVVTWEYPSETYANDKFSSGNFSMQMWINPEEFHSFWIARLFNNRGALGITEDQELLFCDGTEEYHFNLKLKQDKYSHVTVTREVDTLTCYLIEMDEDGNPILQKSSKTLNRKFDLNNATQFELGYFKGFVDEFRLWTKCLSKDEILENFDHLLVGNEKKLETYWTFDEGLTSQFFDYSRDGTVYNEHHGKIVKNAQPQTRTPDALALKAKSDEDGNYIIQGIPFSGEGTTYNIMPTLNSHEFSPTKQSRFISAASLVHNSVDFTDCSSFEVKGTVIYADTNIPVDSVKIYVDGSPVLRNSDIVMTNEEGEFIVDVPIGKHYLTAVRDGHTFVNEGRIPEDPSGLNKNLREFTNPLSGLRFIDNTLVPIVGRVVGGAIEGNKPIGFGESKNNIGKAIITMQVPDTRYMLNAEEKMDEDNPLVSLGFAPVKTNVDLTYPEGMPSPGKAYRTGGKNEDDAKQIVITTDAKTGEFAAMVPPLDYKVLSVVMENEEGRKVYTFNPEQLPRIDASDATTVLQDSIENEDGSYRYFDYVASFKQTLHTEPILSVTQAGAIEGAYGAKSANYVDPSTDEKINTNVYETTGGVVTYNFDYPIFKEMGNYTFNLEGYENYINYDKTTSDSERETRVPLKDVVVTISNELSSSQAVRMADGSEDAGKVVDLKINQLRLDSLGKATYKWKAGLPNIQYPYTRALNMTYNNGAGDYKWKGLNGIIFGDLPSGTNFTTEGPSEVEMILHDPYGDSSFATWESGTVTIESKDTINTHVQENDFVVTLNLGGNIVKNTGTNFFTVETEWDSTLDIINGFDRLMQNDTIDTHTTVLEVTRAISTSSDPDFVGADGDLYIGKSTNLLFGRARMVGLKLGSDGKPHVDVDNVITVGKEFNTNFVYTQYHIENVLIPNLEMLRNDLLETVPDTAKAENNTDKNKYVTTLKPTDENFGQPGTYKVLPKEEGLDRVTFYNDQIKNWYSVIEQNEKYKVNLFKNGKVEKNVSFGGGAEITETALSSKTYSQTISYQHNWTYLFTFDVGLTWNGWGGDIETSNTTTWESTEESSTEETTTATFSYTLSDSGSDDSFSMDVYPASGSHGPVFRTVGGQSSCPYEGQEVTKYYEPGTELSTATMQIEDPEITCDNNMLTGVPTGGKAQFELQLKNNSVTNTDAYFNLVPIDESNSGAKLSLPTGPIGNGRTVLVPAGETVRLILTLEQGNLDVTKYEDIKLALTSTCQNDPTSIHGAIADTVSLNAEFVPASTPVIMAIDKTVLNTKNIDEGLMLTVTGFDRYYTGLKSIDLQYLAPGDQTWSLIKSYIPSESVRANDSQELIPENGVIELPLDMSESKWTDGNYLFRAQSSAIFAGSPVSTKSEELTVIKDVSRPQLYGLANPNDGILNSGDEISVTFNEDIQRGMLTKNNFVISGVLNGAEVQHDVALSAQNTERAAYTEASFNLAQKDFSADMWVRVTDAGDIFTHGNGTDKFKVSVNAEGNLVVTIGSESYTSTKAIEKNTWTFLAFNYEYDGDGGLFSARAVTANSTNDLFNKVAVAEYKGTGAITLGQNFTGAIHELTLWDKSREMSEAQAEMYYTKKPSTPNLIGYWKLDEGTGVSGTDYARNRHMTMPAETWYLNNDNKAVSLNGTDALKLLIADCVVLPTEDYALEMWFKGAKADQGAASTLFYTIEKSVSMGFSAEGALTMTANGSDITISNNDYLDNAWHHLALNVLRNGNATVYVDGTAVKAMSANAVPPLEGSYLYIGSRAGSQPFKGSVDEIRFWKASLTGELIKSQRTQRLTGDETGLEAYYSFEQMSRDPNSGLISSVNNAKDLCTGTKEAAMTSGSITFIDEAPALKVKPEATNVEFSYVANERGIVITLNEEMARLEGSTLKFTVRNVRDMNGNESTPIVWSAFVKQNQLLWSGDNTLNLQKLSGESISFNATFVNESGKAENWTLSGMPAWLTANVTSGTLVAQSSKTVTFTISESLPTGKYEQTVYLTGNNNISEPLTLYINAVGDKPDWAVNAADYECSMNVIAMLDFAGRPCDDADDMVAAFIGDECRGVGYAKYNSRYDTYFILFNIYGHEDENNESITIRAYDASTGIVYSFVESTPALTFSQNKVLGTYTDPVIISTSDLLLQDIALVKGWNWLSIYLTAEDMTVPTIFSSVALKTNIVKSKEAFMEQWGTKWYPTDVLTLNNHEMFMVKMTEAQDLSFAGHAVDLKTETIEVAPGWNWIGYPGTKIISIADAFAGLEPHDGDVVKSQTSFAMYDGYEWNGTLGALIPGEGYMLRNTASEARSFTYPIATASVVRKAPVRRISNDFTPVDHHQYSGNMNIVARVTMDDGVLTNSDIAVYAGEECRAATATDSQGFAYITVPGEDEAKLSFKTYCQGVLISAKNVCTYVNNDVVGSRRSPFSIIFASSDATAIDMVDTDDADSQWFDISGRKLNSDSAKRKGIYILNGKKVAIK
jgi:hypothetical protein